MVILSIYCYLRLQHMCFVSQVSYSKSCIIDWDFSVDRFTMANWPDPEVMKCFYIPHPSEIEQPCVDCRTITTNFCDGELNSILKCKARRRMPELGYDPRASTPFCDWCERRRAICHFCYGQDWVREPINHREDCFRKRIIPRIPMPPKPPSKEAWTQRLRDAFNRAERTMHKQQMQHASPNRPQQTTATSSNQPPPMQH